VNTATRCLYILFMTLIPLGFITVPAAAEIITVQSGNGSVGGLDSLVRFASFGNLTANTPTASDFAAAQTGPLATIFPAGQIGLPLSAYPSALPVYNPAGGSSLFAISFNVPGSEIDTATLDFQFNVDNYLGGAPATAQGLFLNGVALSGDTRFFDPGGQAVDFSGTITRTDIAPLLIPGATNWLYINVTDRLPGAGIHFGATITTSAVPEPSSFVMALAAICIGGASFGRKIEFIRRKGPGGRSKA
jgi:hypothetical protein